jgi:DnaK suppressor protein
MPLLKQRDAMVMQNRRDLQDLLIGEQAEVRDDVDLCSLDQLADLDAALVEIRGEMLEDIDEALERLEAGTYGTCVDCAGPIPPIRLRALPAAERCRPCEESRERVMERHVPEARSHALS